VEKKIIFKNNLGNLENSPLSEGQGWFKIVVQDKKKLYLSPEYFDNIFIRLCVIRKILCIFAKIVPVCKK